MKTFEKFIQDSGAYGPPVSLTRKPVFRSSAMFPVIGNQYYSSRILFMGYWILKREIAEIGLLYTLRDQGGNLLARKSNTINAPRSFVVELNDLLPEQLGGSEFFGSIELEVFSSRDMVFPYPAFVLEFYNETFSTCVHTTGRVYNDIEDLKDCDDYKVSESGFDVYGIPGIDSFFAFVNGPLVNADAIELEAINSRNQSLKAFVADLQIQPYQTVFVDLKKYMPGLDSFLDGTAGTVKIKHNLKGFFPRFLAGNFSRRERNLSITHTYYDCSPLTGADAYWKRASSDLFDSSIYAPIFLDGSRKTELIFYPIHSPSEYEIDLNFLDAEGNSLLKITGYKKCGKAENKLFKIDFNQVLKGRGIALDKVKGVFVSKSWPGSEMIPNRLKYGLNVRTCEQLEVLSSNICFNSQLGVPKTLQKTGTRKWAPIINSGESVVVINNSSTLKEYKRSANIKYKIFRTIDDNYLEREAVIPPLGQLRISTREDREVRDFIGERPGWIYIDSDNPFVNAWYFNFGSAGLVAADHSF